MAETSKEVHVADFLEDAGEAVDSVYIKSVTELGDAQAVITSQDIYSQTGIKLVNEGTSIDSSFYERLVRHKLVPPIDQCLTVENTVDGRGLVEASEQILSSDPLMAKLAETLRAGNALRHALSQLELVPPLAFKLTVAREKRPEVFAHSLRVMLVSLYLGVKAGLKAQDMIALAAAALFHDLGELHIDPALLDRARQLTDEERRHIYAHPVVAYTMLRDFSAYHPHVSNAVLEHHERMDGSGYPRGLKGDGISRLAQILAVAEVVASRCGHGAADANFCAELEVILKLNAKQFGGGLIGHLAVFYQRDGGAAEAGKPTMAELKQRLDRMAQLFDTWEQTQAAAKGMGLSSDMLRFADGKMASLKLALLDAGFNPRATDSVMSGVESDLAGQAELAVLVHETAWQIGMLIREVKRRWPTRSGSEAKAAELFEKWAEEASSLLGS